MIKVAGTHRNGTDWAILRVFDRKYLFRAIKTINMFYWCLSPV